MAKRPVSAEVHRQCTHPVGSPPPPPPWRGRRKEEACDAAATQWSDPSQGCRGWSGVQINMAFMLAICPQVSGDRDSKSLSLMNEYTMTVLCVAKGSSHRNMVARKSGSANLARGSSCVCAYVYVFAFNPLISGIGLYKTFILFSVTALSLPKEAQREFGLWASGSHLFFFWHSCPSCFVFTLLGQGADRIPPCSLHSTIYTNLQILLFLLYRALTWNSKTCSVFIFTAFQSECINYVYAYCI